MQILLLLLIYHLTTASHEGSYLSNQKSIVMKKLRTIFAAAALLLATSVFATAGPEKVSAKVKAAFEKSFTGAVNVNWEKSDDFYFAHFELNSKETSAAYNENGELVGTSRVVTTAQLPLNVLLAIAAKYDGYAVAKTATELTYEGQTNYYVLVENTKQVLRLKCIINGDIAVDSKTKK